MTHPGGSGNDINLATMWVPIMPETSRVGEVMEQSGKESKRRWEQGFNSGSSPESMGQSFGQKLQTAITKEFQHFELPYGASGFLDKFSSDIDQKLVSKLRGQATQALQAYRTEWDNLAAAQARAKEAEDKLNLARDNGIKSAQVVLPLTQQHIAAQNNLTEAHTKAAGALDNYNKVNGKLNEELSKSADGGKIMAGIMGGAIVLGAQLAVHAVESLVDTIAEGFEKSIEITVELAKQAVELGETYEHIGIQIHEFSTATGEDFERTEAAAQRVFSTLDVAGNDVGKTMAQLSSMMKVPGESIQSLVRNVTELQGRYTSLKAADLGAAFVAFKTPAQEADKALASLLASARGSGQDLGQLTSALSGNVAITLHEAGLNIEQAGKFTADLLEKGEPGRQVMAGMATAMKDFKSEGLSFSEGMKEAGTQLQALGDTVAGQDLAETLFGTRNWILAKDAVKDYVNIINQAPDAFSATTASTQQFLDQTETLGNKIEEFKHQAEEAFKPFGEAALKTATTGLNSLSTWFTTHRQDIVGTIKHWGDTLLDFIPVAQKWTVDALDIFALFAEGMGVILSPVVTALGLAGAGMLAITGHLDDAGKLLKATGEFDWDVFSGKLGLSIDGIKSKIESMHLDTTGIKEDFDAAAQSAMSIPPIVGSGATQGLSPSPGESATAPGAPGAPRGTGPLLPWFPGGPAAPGAPAPGVTPGAPGMHHADWDAIAQNESSGRWNVPTPGPVPEGGGLQIKPDTWYEFGGFKFAEKPYLASKADQITVAERILNGWGSNPGQGPKAWANGATYVEKKAKGGAPGTHVTGGSGMDDDVPALLKRGEYVWDTDTVDKWGWLISALHEGKGFHAGGEVGEDPHTGSSGVLQVIYSNSATGEKTGEAGGQRVGPGTTQPGYYGGDWEGHKGHVHTSFATSPFGEFYGLPKGTDIRQGASGFPQWVYMVGEAFGLEASTYAGHQEGSGFNRGIDWWPKGHSDMSGESYSNEEKQRLQTFASSIATYGSSRGGNAGSPAAWGTAPLSGGTPGSDGPVGYPGMPGQYGGYGVYGGETEDQRAALEKAVREANDHKADLDAQVVKNQRAVDDLKDAIAHVGDSTKVGALGHPEALTPAEQAAVPEKRKKLQEQLDDATETLARSTREAGEAQGDIADATRKQAEGLYKKPSGTTAAPKAVGEAAFQQLGAGFLSGIGQELGFGDLFAKPPWEWGAVKLLTGAASWAMGTANAWADEIGKGHTGMTGFQPVEGYDQPGGGSSILSGLASSMGLNIPMPKASVSAGPNVVPVQPDTTVHGTGQGQPPGPVTVDNSIHVSSDVSDTKVLAPVQELANSANSSRFTYDQGMPH